MFMCAIISCKEFLTQHEENQSEENQALFIAPS